MNILEKITDIVPIKDKHILEVGPGTGNLTSFILNNNPNIQIIDTYENLFEWIQLKKIKHLILPYETIGNKIFDSPNFLKKLSYKDVNYQFHVREWDRNALAYAKKGFFNFKKNIPYLLDLSNL